MINETNFSIRITAVPSVGFACRNGMWGKDIPIAFFQAYVTPVAYLCTLCTIMEMKRGGYDMGYAMYYSPLLYPTVREETALLKNFRIITTYTCAADRKMLRWFTPMYRFPSITLN